MSNYVFSSYRQMEVMISLNSNSSYISSPFTITATTCVSQT